MKVACYIRVSTTEQCLHGISLDAQRDILQRYANVHNWEIYAWYCDEGVSGRKLIRNRPELQRMIIDGENKKFDHIIFIKLDRFFRSVSEYYECMKRLGKITWTATEEQYDLTTASGRMLVNMKLTIAELEADQTSERIKLVNEYKVRQGQAVGNDRSLPKGYTTKKIEGVRRVVKDEEEKPIVEDLLRYFFNCETVGKTAVYMNEKYGFSYDNVRSFLQSPLIIGTYKDNNNYCEPYVTQEEYERIQRILSRHSRYSPSRNRHYIFTSLFKCKCCGYILRSYPAWKKNSYGKKYLYKGYKCTRYTLYRDCINRSVISEKTLEKYVIEECEKHFGNPDIKAHSKQEKIKVDNKDKLKRLNYMFEVGRISIEEYDKKYKLLNEEVKTVQSEPITLDSNWKEVYSMLDEEHKNIFWKKLINYMTFDEHRNIEINWAR